MKAGQAQSPCLFKASVKLDHLTPEEAKAAAGDHQATDDTKLCVCLELPVAPKGQRALGRLSGQLNLLANQQMVHGKQHCVSRTPVPDPVLSCVAAG